MTHYNVYPNKRNRLKRVEKLRRLKSQPLFCDSSQTEWRESFNFSNRNFRFSHVNVKYTG